MAHFPKWFLFNESEEQRRLRHASLRKILSDSAYQKQLRDEAAKLKAELEEKRR